jgi:hypothetical protein
MAPEAPALAMMGAFRMFIRSSLAGLVAIAALTIPAGALASPLVSIDSAVFVERIDPASGRTLAPVKQLRRGDRVVYMVAWTRMGGQGGFTVTNPLPDAVAYQRSADGTEEVSIDGGRTWGRLAQLRKGERSATPEDVTHVRWRVSPREAALGYGRITYSAIVR